MFASLKEFIKKHEILHIPAKYLKGRFLRAKLILRKAGEGSYLVSICRNYTSNEFCRNMLINLTAPFRVWKYFFTFSNPNRKGLAFVLIAKNEAPYIEEWIKFHLKQGASHFIIYDNESTDNFHEVLKPYIDSGIVTYSTIKGKPRQLDAYNIAIHKYGHKFKYMAFIDCDEFLFLRKNTYGGGGINLYGFIDDFMNTHKNAGGIAVNWLIFGSSGHETKPAGGVLESYTMCAEKDAPANYHIKTICDPMKVFVYHQCHFPMYRKGFYNLSENGEIIRGPFSQTVSFEKIRINHYHVKSKEEYILKINRGRATCNLFWSMEDFRKRDKNEVRDTEILSLT